MLFLGTGVAEADDGKLEVEVISVTDQNFPALTAVVSVESDGRPITTLTPAEVTVTDNGSPVVVKSVSLAQDTGVATSVVLTLDISGSMQGDKLAQAKVALSGLSLRLQSTDKVALLTFANKVQVVTQPSSDKSGLGGTIAGLQAAGDTALYAAVSESARIAATESAARRLVILVSDGEEFGNVSGISREDSLARAVAGGAIYYVIGIGQGADRAYLAELAAATGGRYLDAPGTADIQAGFAAIEETLRGQFVIALESSAPPLPLARSLVVKVSRGTTSGSATHAFESQRPLPVAVAPPPAVATAPPAPPAQEAVSPPAQVATDDAGVNPLWVILPITALVALGAGLFFLRKSRAAPPTVVQPEAPPAPVAPLPESPSTSLPQAPAARLLKRDGPDSLPVPDMFAVPQHPISVGWSAECEIRLPQTDGLAGVHARLWWRDGRVMLHHLGRGTTTLNGAPTEWASLSEGDSVSFGLFSFVVDLTAGERV